MIIKENNANFSLLKSTLKYILYVLVSLIFTKYYYLLTYESYPPAYASNVAEFTADKVFQKRFLVPLLSKYTSEVTMLDFDQSLKAYTVISTLLLILSFGSILRNLSPGINTYFWSFFVLIPVTWNYSFLNSIYHAYDIPTLAFYCVALSFYINKNYILFYCVFLLATFNRESTCFITITIFLIFFRFDNIKSFSFIVRNNLFLLKNLLIQSLLWTSTIIMIRYIVKDNPGVIYENPYSAIKFLNDIIEGNISWPFLNNDHFFSNPRSFLTLFAGIWVFIPLLWSEIPLMVRKLLLFIPIYIVPLYLYANIMETRVYHELNIIISLVSVCALHNFIQSNFKKHKDLCHANCP